MEVSDLIGDRPSAGCGLKEWQIPGCELCLTPGTHVRLGRFRPDSWRVGYGWYACDGNRPICGWYLTNDLTKQIKSLQWSDLDDIYVVEMADTLPLPPDKEEM